jgi:hypothetical protein
MRKQRRLPVNKEFQKDLGIERKKAVQFMNIGEISHCEGFGYCLSFLYKVCAE